MDTPDFRRWLLPALLMLALPAQAQRALLSHAETSAKLIRKNTVYDAPPGASLLPGDIVAAGQRGLQIEWSNGALMALGPDSSVVLENNPGTPAVSLLRGWFKLAAVKPANSQLSATAGQLSLRADQGSVIVHVAPDKSELFVEQGKLPLTETDRGAIDGPQTVGREQYALRRGTQALQVMPRAPKLFIGEMPRAFFDPLVAIGNRVRPAELAPVREANAADDPDWRPTAQASQATAVLPAMPVTTTPPAAPKKRTSQAINNTLF
ncbi:hypothetical protein FHW58_001205 [Duganella sp. 1224]|uniref:hypothetical protein n=1 Tax=Duganella sp. 1224 TaxID=2587052 RepID=UPI0015CED362|nr:hypothetical protein [Duganella sp. 1224]NYE60053.1 hypothetical protein [Duganella sp. 1224]